MVRRKSERVPKARAWGSVGESTRGGIPPLVSGARGISPEKIFDLRLPLCAFLMRFEPEFQPSWADLVALSCISIMESLDTVSGLRIVMHANSKSFIHILPTDMFFDLE